MDKRQFSRILHSITEQEIPDDMNRWNEIKAKAQQTQIAALPSRPVRISMRAVFIFILLFVSAAGGYAFYQQTLPFEPRGMDGASEAGLLTSINYSQTIDNVTVTVRWAYADESRVVVCTETAVDGSPHIYQLERVGWRVRLYEMQGMLVDRIHLAYDDDKICQRAFSFTLPADVEIPDPMNLTFELVYFDKPRPATFFEQLIVGHEVSEGLTSFDDPIVPTLSPEVTREPMPVRDGGIGPFIFNFNLSRLGGVTLNPNETVMAAGIPITLRKLTVAPSKTDLEICIDAAGYENWWPQVSITAGDINTDWGGGSTRGYRGTSSICYSLYYDVFIEEQPDTVTITITALEQHMHRIEGAYDKVKERAIELGATFGVNGSYNPLESQQYLNQAMVEFGYRIEGPWVFEVDLP